MMLYIKREDYAQSSEHHNVMDNDKAKLCSTRQKGLKRREYQLRAGKQNMH
jgi:hypothetical protein